LDKGKGKKERELGGFCVCASGRPCRAKEIKEKFFEVIGKRVEKAPTTEPYMVYQEHTAADGQRQGHVLLRWANGSQPYVGTGDYRSPGWIEIIYAVK